MKRPDALHVRALEWRRRRGKCGQLRRLPRALGPLALRPLALRAALVLNRSNLIGSGAE
jgi:hypothetical protein